MDPLSNVLRAVKLNDAYYAMPCLARWRLQLAAVVA
jgi:hypothetical protein